MRLRAGQFEISLLTPSLMGIINVTPDSFSDGGKIKTPADAYRHAWQMCAEGATIIDIGGESSRPGANSVPLEEELERVLPVIEACANLGKPLSIDTSKPEVMYQAVAAGVSMINDIYGFRQHGAFEMACSLAKEKNIALCIMHMQGEPGSMQHKPEYQDVVKDVKMFLEKRAQDFQLQGVPREQLLIDPGFGFGKTMEHQLQLLKNLSSLLEPGYPILVGLSRKSILGHITGRSVDQRLSASVAGALLAVQHGASIVRVHDVSATRDALEIWRVLRDYPSP